MIEITHVFTYTSQGKTELLEIDYDEWKQKFVEWANEFESRWEDNAGRDYIGDITEFAAGKIDEYYEEVKGK